MNFLPYILVWLVGRASGHSQLNACKNNKSGNEGICLLEGLCIRIGGLNIGTCTFSTTKNICCKTFGIGYGVNNASSVNLPNIISSYEEIETYSTSSVRKTVLPEFHDPQNTVDMDSAGNSQEVSTNKRPHNVNQNYSSDSLWLSVNLDQKLKNHVPLKLKQYVFKSIKKDPQMPEKKLSRNQILHWRNIKHNLHKLVNRKGLLFNKSLVKQEYHDLRNPVQIHVTDYNRNPVQRDSTFYMQKPVQIDSSHNIQKQVPIALEPVHRKFVKGTTTRDMERPTMLTVDYFLRNSIQIQRISDLQKPVKTDIAFDLEKPVQVDPSLNLRTGVKVSDSYDRRWSHTQKFSQDLRNFRDINTVNILREPAKTNSTFSLQKSIHVNLSHDLHKVVKLPDSQDLQSAVMQESNHDLRNPVKVHATNDLHKPVQTDSTFYSRKPVQLHSSHNLRKAVKVSESHDLRWPVVQELDHNLRNPVQVHVTNNLRKPVQIDTTFYLQKPVQVHSSHNLRKAVKVADSHDLRWPVVQEPDHDLRNLAADIDFFRSENEETKLDKIIKEYAKKTYKEGNMEGTNDPIYELVHEDDRIKSNCAHGVWNRNINTSGSKTSLDNKDNSFHQKISFRNSTKACGIPYNESPEYLDFQERNSNMGPWMVSVQEYFFGKFRHKCGGSLLNNLWVITAAHCVDLRPKWDFLLKFRSENNGESQNYVERLVNKISIHPKYNNINFDNDIALLRMEIPVTFQSNIVPICLPDTHERMMKRKAVIFGWKLTTRQEKSSGEAQAETVPVLTNKECEVMFSETGVSEGIEENFVCAGARSVKESCTGDSGGPLAVLDARGKWSLAGLYSWGKSCKIPNQPEVYISVKSYVNWIEDTIACFEHYINLSKIND